MNDFDLREWRAFCKAFRYLLTVVGVSVVLLRLIFFGLQHQPDFNAAWVSQRLNEALAYIDDLPEIKEPLLLFLGASDVEVGVDPTEIEALFKERGRPVFAFNLGVRNLDPKLLNLLAKRISRTLQRQRRRADVVVIKFAPLLATRQYASQVRGFRFFKHLEYYMAAIYDFAMMREDYRQASEAITAIFFTRYFFGGVSPLSVAAYLWSHIRTRIDIKVAARENDGFESANQLNNSTWANPLFHTEPAWNKETHGSFFFNYPSSSGELDKVLARYQNATLFHWIVERFNYRSGAQDLEIDGGLLSEFIQAIHTLKQIANHVVIIYHPELVGVERKQSAQDHLDQALDQIASLGEVTVLNYEKSHIFSEEDFFDHIHLGLKGRSKLAHLLVEDLDSLVPRTNL